MTIGEGRTMGAAVRSSTAVVATGIAIVALTPAPPTPALELARPAIVSHDIRLSAMTVPPGGLIASFLGNQLLYCSLICTSAVNGVATVSGVALQTPATFINGLQSGNLLKAIGATAASVTGAAETAAADVIFKDGMEVAPRALNAFEVGVVGLLNILPAARSGLPGLLAAIETARRDTYTALNRPIVPNPEPTVRPRGVLQVAVIGAINVVAAVIFPALNDVLLGAFQVPNAVAQTLARTGDPLQAVGAGLTTAVRVAGAAVRVIVDAAATAISDVRAVSQLESPRSLTVDKSAATESVTATAGQSPAKREQAPRTAIVKAAAADADDQSDDESKAADRSTQSVSDDESTPAHHATDSTSDTAEDTKTASDDSDRGPSDTETVRHPDTAAAGPSGDSTHAESTAGTHQSDSLATR
jgi:hypothetical protein